MAVLVIDVGSSSVRALIYEAADGGGTLSILDHTAKPYRFDAGPDGMSQVDADALRDMVERCIDRVLTPDVHVVGLDTFAGNLLAVDAHNVPLTPVYTYADTRSAHDAAVLRQQVDPAAVHERTGCLIHPAYSPAKLRWLRRTQPQVFARAARFVDFGTYLLTQWFGAAPVSTSLAAWSGLLDTAAMTWDAHWYAVLHLQPRHIPALADFDKLLAGLRPQYAARWPALRTVPFTLPLADGAAASVGLGCTDPSRVALSLGTTAALRAVTPHLHRPPAGLWRYCIDSRRYLVGGATTEGGSVAAWARATLSLPDDWEQHIARREPDAHGLTFLPLLAGERSPGWQADASGVFAGLRVSTTALDMMQAALEAVALRLAAVADQLTGITPADAPVIASGGALSPLWAQIIANALNRPLHIAAAPEITARGTALLALEAIGTPQDAPPAVAHVAVPNPDHVALLRAARVRQAALYRRFYG